MIDLLNNSIPCKEFLLRVSHDTGLKDTIASTPRLSWLYLGEVFASPFSSFAQSWLALHLSVAPT